MILMGLGVILSRCVDPFELKSIGSEDLLVVEGLLTDQPGTQSIKLSRTSSVDADSFEPVVNASVQVEDAEGLVITYLEARPGIYETSPFINGTIGATYQLSIETEDGRRYQSEPVMMRPTPPIGGIEAEFVRESEDITIDRDAIKIYAQTGDQTGNTRFYRWEWEDTYEINTLLSSDFEWVGGNNVVRRQFPTDRCWASDTSSSVLIKSTQNLDEDIVFRQLIHSIRSVSEAWRVKYSILLKQYSLSERGYNFWEQLKTINEGQGSLFDQQPAAVVGNISSITDNNEIVLGYFDAAQERELRVFYTPEDFADQGFSPSVTGINCEQDSVAIESLGEFLESRETTVTPWVVIDVDVNQFLVAPRACADCTRKGTNEIPSFWR